MDTGRITGRPKVVDLFDSGTFTINPVSAEATVLYKKYKEYKKYKIDGYRHRFFKNRAAALQFRYSRRPIHGVTAHTARRRLLDPASRVSSAMHHLRCNVPTFRLLAETAVHTKSPISCNSLGIWRLFRLKRGFCR